jgi:2-polyprenyl-3-methyl-5-hydroxy-6-metoxy-1,4-benzoquinol methylase
MSTNHKTDTAHQEWDKIWQMEEGRKKWSVPEPFVTNVLSLLQERKCIKVLDLGCGIGRHALFFAQNNMEVHALDASKHGLEFLEQSTRERGLTVHVNCSGMTILPYEDESFDYVLAWNVIYHGNISVVQRSLSEVSRILKTGGIFQGSMLSRRNDDLLTGVPISHNTYIVPGKSDKDHPHFYCNAAELIQLLAAFELMKLEDVKQGTGSYHWQFIAEKK